MSNSNSSQPTHPLNILLGVLISGGLAIPAYFLTTSIVQSYANKPITSSNQTAIAISVAVRTLVMGSCILVTAVFALVAVGLLLLFFQSLLEGKQQETK